MDGDIWYTYDVLQRAKCSRMHHNCFWQSHGKVGFTLPFYRWGSLASESGPLVRASVKGRTWRESPVSLSTQPPPTHIAFYLFACTLHHLRALSLASSAWERGKRQVLESGYIHVSIPQILLELLSRAIFSMLWPQWWAELGTHPDPLLLNVGRLGKSYPLSVKWGCYFSQCVRSRVNKNICANT